MKLSDHLGKFCLASSLVVSSTSFGGASNPPPEEQYVDGFALIDAETEETLQNITSYSVLNLEPYSGRKLDFKVNAARDAVNSVEINWNSTSSNIDSARPFRLWGIEGAPSGTLVQGPHTLSVRAYNQSNATGDFLQEKRATVYINTQQNDDGDDGGGDDGDDGGRRERPKFPNEPSQVERISKPITVKAGQTYDAKGKGFYATYDSCNQDEGMRPCFYLEKGAKLINAHMMRCPDGIHTKGDDVTIEKVYFHTVCEDAITVRHNRATIKDSWFKGGQDKTLQLTSGRGGRVEGNVFLDSVRPVRSGDTTVDLVVQDNEFWNIKSDNIILQKGSAIYKNNYTDGTNCMIRVKDRGVVYNEGGNQSYNVKKRESSCLESGGRIVNR